MSDKSHIEWTDATWNPVTGCTKVSAGCDHCYIDRSPPFRMQGRKFDQPGVGGTTGVTLHPTRLEQPLRWTRPRRVFVNSLSDLFHANVPADFVAEVFAVMAVTPQHTYQILTKRTGRMRAMLSSGEFFDRFTTAYALRLPDESSGPHLWPLPNVWLGVSVESQQWADIRIPALLDTPAAVRFLSCEPLLGPVDLSTWTDAHAPWNYTEFGVECSCGAAIVDNRDRCNGDRISWVIAGGESGPRYRPVDLDWFRTIRDQCTEAGVAFFLKQIGGRTPKANGNELDGQVWEQFPDDVKVGAR